MEYKSVTWHPLKTNILDADDYNMILKTGETVKLDRTANGGFILKVNGLPVFSTDDNIVMSGKMIELEVGILA